MKTRSYLALSTIGAAVFLTVVPRGTYADTQATNVGGSSRLINLLAIDDMVSLQSSDGAYDVELLDDDTLRSFNANVARLKKGIEAAKQDKGPDDNAESKRKRMEMIESGWHQLSSPWKVTHIGEDFVRFEPVEQLPRHEKVSWIAIAEKSIRQIKSTK